MELANYVPVCITSFALILIGIGIADDAQNGIWDVFEIGVVIFTLCALAWWLVVKTNGGI